MEKPVKVYVIDSTLKLRGKQPAFVYEYLKDYNATQAAIRAGYSKHTAKSIGAENLTKPDIATAIDDGKWFYQYQNGIDADWIRKERKKLFDDCTEPDKPTARGLLADMAKDIGMDAPTTVNVNQSGTLHHEHTVKDQMDFTKIHSKVENHRNKRLDS